MNVEANLYKNFKSYEHFKNRSSERINKNLPQPPKNNLKPLIGSTLGVGAALLASSKLPKNGKTLNEVGHMLLMAGGANVGGVLAGSIGADEKQKAKKWKEAGFQVMNISIPMLMVSAALEICKKVKGLNKNLPKVIASVTGMISGAMIATAITNATREEGEPYRKYTPKDAIANFDDIVATVKIGFKDILKYIPVDKILPFIYIYSGTRAGSKE
ncbi:hypothetical protein IJ425_06320 [bacterium]|nr:hypothetical protein [bacterium]